MDVIALVGGAGNFVDLLGEHAAGMQAQARAQFRDLVRRDLRAIRFGAPGVLDQLKRMRDGTRVLEYEWRPVLQAFNDGGWAIDTSLQRVAAAVEQAGLPFGSKDAPFERIEELQQVLGMTPALYEGLTRLLTVSSGAGGINPMLAPRQTLMLLAEGDAAKVDAYITQRDEAAKEGRSVLPDFGQAFFDSSQQPLYRMQIKVFTDETAPPYFEERSIRLSPQAVPPFVTYFRVLQATQAAF